MVGVLEQVCLFFMLSPKHNEELAGHIANLPEGATNLVNICKTRWVARIESFEAFIAVAPAVAMLY
jgi:hypothetical protein